MRRILIFVVIAVLASTTLTNADQNLQTIDARDAFASNPNPAIHPDDNLRFIKDGDVWFPLGFYGGALHQVRDDPQWEMDPALEPAEEANNAFMAALESAGLNFFRAWIHWPIGGQDPEGWDYHQVHPYNRPASVCTESAMTPGPDCAVDGKHKFNLDQFNAAYFDMIERQVQTANSRGLVVQVVVLDCWHVVFDDIERNYFHSHNNSVTVDLRTSGEWLAADVEHSDLRIRKIAQYQKAFVDRVVAALGDEPNVIWETCNEGPSSAERADLDSLVASSLRTDSIPHLIVPLDLPEHRYVPGYQVPNADPHTGQSFGAMRADLITARAAGEPLISDNDWKTLPYPGTDFTRTKVWAALTAGAHVNFFHDHMNGTPGDLAPNSQIVAGMRQYGYVLDALDQLDVNLVGMTPKDAETSKADDWVYGRTGDEYLIYLPTAGSTTLTNPPTFRRSNWINPRTGQISLAERGPSFSKTGSSDWALHVKKETTTIPPGAFFADSFAPAAPNREAGDALSGTTTEIGNRTWTATSPGLGMGDGHVTNTASTTSALAAGIAFGTQDFTQRVATVQAVVDASQSNWIGVGFSSSATGPYWNDGQIWLFLRDNGQLQVKANGTSHALKTEQRAAWAGGRHRLALAYDRVDHTVRAWVDGEEIVGFTISDLDTVGFSPNILYAGFHAYGGASGYPGTGRVVIDDFAVNLSGAAVQPGHSLIASYLPAGGGPRTTFTSTSANPTAFRFYYDESLGNFEQRPDGACHDGYSNPGYLRVRYLGEGIDSCSFKLDWDSAAVPCSSAHIMALQDGVEITIPTDDYAIDAGTCRRTNPLVPRVRRNETHWFDLNIVRGGQNFTRRVNFIQDNVSPPYLRLVGSYVTTLGGPRTETISSVATLPAFGFYFKQSLGSFEQRTGGRCPISPENPTYLKVHFEGETFNACTFQSSLDSAPIACPTDLVTALIAGTEITINADQLQTAPGGCPVQFTTQTQMAQNQQHWLRLNLVKNGVTYVRQLNYLRTNAQQ